MNLALAEAERGRGAVEPNPMVGAVLVREGRVVGLGHHARFGGPHAEVMALQNAAEARGATLYVTLEPCCHHGKTPPCTDAIPQAGVAVDLGLQAGTAAELNAPYLKRVATGLPYITAKWAMTLDGKTAVASGDSQWISSPGSRSLVHQLRGRMDAILVGIGTVLADDPQLTARPAGPRTAARIVLDSKALLPLNSRLVQTAREVPVLVAVSRQAPADRRHALEARGCEVVVFPGETRVPIMALLAELGQRAMTNLLVEGGGRVLGSFLEAGQVDEVEAYIAPILEGGDHPHTPARGQGRLRMGDAARLQNVAYSEVDGDVRVRGTVAQPWRSILSDLGRETSLISLDRAGVPELD